MQNSQHFTGERVIGDRENDLFLYSKERYIFARTIIPKGSVVLDIACGTGYGSMLLAKKAKKVIGVDIDANTIMYCKQEIKKSNIQFMHHGNAPQKKLKKMFDAIVCLETIEHVPDYNTFLSMLRSYLKPGGILIISTPNNYQRIHPSTNPFHVYEFDISELFSVLCRFFPKAQIETYGQKFTRIQKGEKPKKHSMHILMIKKFVQVLYELDKSTFSLLDRISHTSLYKKLGRMQHDSPFDPNIYPLDIQSQYFQPHISVFLIRLP